MKSKKVIGILSPEVQAKILNNVINEFDDNSTTAALGFYQYKMHGKFDRSGLSGWFVYDSTPEGSAYWRELNEALIKVIFTK